MKSEKGGGGDAQNYILIQLFFVDLLSLHLHTGRLSKPTVQSVLTPQAWSQISASVNTRQLWKRVNQLVTGLTG